MQKSYLEPQNVIFSTGPVNRKIYIREQSGYFQRIRRGLNALLISLFVLVPFIPYNNHQAVFFDVAAQKFHFFAITLYPQDLGIFALLFILAAFALFAITKVYGRVWCGFACPQTVWTLMFNWIERRIEGTNNQSRALDRQPWSLSKISKKLGKHLAWAALSFLTALVFMSYFIPVDKLYPALFSMQMTALTFGWVAFFAGCTYVNGGWVREKMCQHMCPYSRFQAAMFDKETKLVTYQQERGESRGPRRRNQPKPEGKGDCVDCDLCVQVCPVGIDIRQGMQYECINCGLCVDACNDTMSKFNYPLDLIGFSSEKTGASMWDQKLGYLLAIVLTVAAIFTWAATRESFEVSVLRDRQALYRVNYLGHTENIFTLKLLNKTEHNRELSIALEDASNMAVKGSTRVHIKAGELLSKAFTLVSEQPVEKGRSPVTFVIKDVSSGETIQRTSTFFSD